MCKPKYKADPAIRKITHSTHKNADTFEKKKGHGLMTPYISQRPTFWRKIWFPSSESKRRPFKKPPEWDDTLRLLLLVSLLAYYSTLKSEVIFSSETSDIIRRYNPRYHTLHGHIYEVRKEFGTVSHCPLCTATLHEEHNGHKSQSAWKPGMHIAISSYLVS
jgi:hypothetical protein